MIKESIYQQYKDSVVNPALRIQIEILDEDYHKNKQKHMDSFQKIIEQFLQKTTKENLTHVHLSWLRTNFWLKQELQYTLESFNENWIDDCKPDIEYFDYTWLLPYMLKFYHMLQEETTRKFAFIPKISLERAFYEAFPIFQQYVREVIRECLLQVQDSRLSELNFRVGEYHGISELMYTGQRTKENPRFELIHRAPQEYFAKDVSDMPAESLEYEKIILPKIHFNHCKFDHSIFKEGIFVGSHFEDCSLQNCSFEFSFLHDANFSRANCQGTNFRSIAGNMDLACAEVPSYYGISFREANLSGCDFRLAQLKGVDFTGANLEGAKFFAEQRRYFPFTAKQNSQIHWMREEEIA
ncbi:hypothetical protein FACS189418_6030 [Clostridia bacterium]|nr:hypothetical protein FACS189418_6030 [Clostridia bacterium]